MNTVATLGARLNDFRQNYTPTANMDGGGRHWMLDFAPARDVLKIALLDQDPAAKACLFSESGVDIQDLDRRLDSMIDVLNIRSMPAPVGPFCELKTSCTLLMLSIRALLRRLATEYFS